MQRHFPRASLRLILILKETSIKPSQTGRLKVLSD